MSGFLSVQSLVVSGLNGFDDIQLELHQGQTGLILGGPKAGKSRLFRLLAGEGFADSGHIGFQGQDVTGQPVWRRRRLGIALASQAPPRFDLLCAEEQICLCLGRRRLPGRHKRMLLQILPELEALLSTPMIQLSHQAHRLVDLAGCLVTAPSLILLDEPAVDFGPERAQALVRALRLAGITLLIADRYAGPMLEIADHAWLLANRRIALSGAAASLAGNKDVHAACLG